MRMYHCRMPHLILAIPSRKLCAASSTVTSDCAWRYLEKSYLACASLRPRAHRDVCERTIHGAPSASSCPANGGWRRKRGRGTVRMRECAAAAAKTATEGLGRPRPTAEQPRRRRPPWIPCRRTVRQEDPVREMAVRELYACNYGTDEGRELVVRAS